MELRSSLFAERYELGEELGRGAVAEVRAAHDTRLDRPVAIKLFDITRWSDERAQRFEREARLAAAITHPNVVFVYDVGIADEVPFIVMERAPGGSLAAELRKGRLTVSRTNDVLFDVLAGLGAAHELGVLHRDLKPANVLFAADGRAQIADFGIATTSETSDLTETGMVVGTPAYLAPERVTGGSATVASDLYAVGVIGYEMLTGTTPFAGESPIAVAYAVHGGDVEPLATRRPDTPAPLVAAIDCAMARDPARRFADTAQFADALAPADPTALTVASPVVAPTDVLPVVAAPDTPVRAPRRTRRAPVAMAAFACAVVIAIGAFALATRSNTPPRNSSPTESTVPHPLQAPFDALDHAVNR